jgi:hypothetical protein
MQGYGKAIQVADVKWTKIMVESIIQERVVDGKIHRFQTGRIDNLIPIAFGGTATAWPHSLG